VIRTELVPIRIDLGYRIPHFYVGGFAQKAHETTDPQRLTSETSAAKACTVNDFEMGATVEYHFAPDARAEPWVGIYGARRILWLTRDDGEGLRLKGPEGGLTAGFDVRVGRRFGLGAYVSGGYSILAVSFADDTSPLTTHAKATWVGLGVRAWSIL